MKAATKLIPASALALSLVVFTSCRIENIVPDLEPYMKEVTGSDSTTFMSALTAASSASSSNTTDFKEGFKSGYAAGYAEAAKKYIGNTAVTQSQAQPQYNTVAPTVSNTVQTVSAVSSDKIPSWGYTSSNYTATATTTAKPAAKKSTSSYKSSSSYSRSRSSSRCAGGR